MLPAEPRSLAAGDEDGPQLSFRQRRFPASPGLGHGEPIAAAIEPKRRRRLRPAGQCAPIGGRVGPL